MYACHARERRLLPGPEAPKAIAGCTFGLICARAEKSLTILKARSTPPVRGSVRLSFGALILAHGLHGKNGERPVHNFAKIIKWYEGPGSRVQARASRTRTISPGA